MTDEEKESIKDFFEALGRDRDAVAYYCGIIATALDHCAFEDDSPFDEEQAFDAEVMGWEFRRYAEKLEDM